MRNCLLVGLTLCALTAFGQNPAPKLSCEHGGFNHDRLISHCEMREQALGASRGPIEIDPGTNGGVSVKGWDRPDVLVRSQIQTAAETEAQAKAMVSQIRTSSGAGLIKAEGPEMNRQQSWSVSYEIFVPRQTDVSAKAYNGGIHLSDLRGRIEFSALNGGVTLQRLSGDVRGHTTNGGLKIELAGDRWDGRGMDVQTTNRGVKLEVPANYSAHFETSTVNGGINVDFPVSVSGRIDRQAAFDIGSGGATIRAVTTNGGVKIHKS